MDSVLLIGIIALFGAVCLVWKIWIGNQDTQLAAVPTRRREDARDWQRRFGADSLLNANFLQPTQNEILETLYVLDHLNPGWETGDASSVEHRFLNELALNFPTLCKAGGTFPLPCAETPVVSGEESLRELPTSEEQMAGKREEFRLSRAQFNALEQIVSGSVAPAELIPGSLPFRPSAAVLHPRGKNPWPARLAGLAVLFAGVLVIVHFFPKLAGTRSAESATGQVFVTPTPIPQPVAAELPPIVAQVIEPVVATTPTSTPTTVVASAPTAIQTPPPPSTPTKESVALGQQVAASKQRAVSKYPALATEGSEINLRFVFRYKNLVQQNSPRLLDPTWPEQLVEECAMASGIAPKHNAFTQVLGTPR